MPRMRLASFGVGFLFMLWVVFSDRLAVTYGDEVVEKIRPSIPAGPLSPLSPRESLEHFRLHPSLRIELVAAEPQVIDPVAVRFDEDGRMWVVEMRDYPHGPAKGEKPKSRIRILEDRDGDGRFETSRVFADELLFVTGVQPWKGGVFVTLAGRVAYMKDTDGDGRADVDETWYAGFAQKNTQLRANHPRLGLDNQIYIANGLRGGAVVDASKPGSKPVSISGMDFRFDPLTRKFEAVSGMGQFGLTFDDYGNRFVCSNRNPLKHIVLEQRYLKQNPNVAVPSMFHDVAKSGAESRIYPISRAWTTSNLHAGQFTAACGVNIYRGDALPKAFYGNAFICDPTGNLVHREIIKPMGATFTSRPGRKGVEFLASRDEWFRPVNLEVGPDGALYVVDMYRAVIEHPQFMPEELKSRPDLLKGSDRGRIWRIVSKVEKPSRKWPKRPRLSKVKSEELVKLFEHPNAWWRETAQRLILQRQHRETAAFLKQVVEQNDNSHLARIHALWSLQGIGETGAGDLNHASRDESNRVREQALAITAASGAAGLAPRFLRQPFPNAHDRAFDQRFYFQVLLNMSFAKDSDGWARPEPVRWASRDPWTRRALVIAVKDQAAAALAAHLKHKPGSSKGSQQFQDSEIAIAVELAQQVRLNPKSNELSRVFQSLASWSKDSAGRKVRFVVLRALAQAFLQQKTTLRAQIENADKVTQADLVACLCEAAKVAADRSKSADFRLTALDLIAYIAQNKDVLADLSLHEPQQAIRLRAIAGLARHADLEPWRKLIGRFANETPAVRFALIQVMLARSNRTHLLLDEIAAGRIKAAELDRTHVNRLLKHGDAKIRGRVRKLLADAIPADRKKVLADYQLIFKLKADPRRGMAVFKKNCAACHRVGGVGVNVAPDISDSRTKKPEQLLTDILQPNRAIDANYISYTINTADGRSLTGIIVSESATSVTIKQPENKIVTLLRSDIEQMQSGGISLMPEGLEKNVPPQAMADVISFIKNWRYLDGRTPLRKTE